MDEKRNLELTCKQVSRLISEYIDNELDEATAAAVASHIEHCDDCRRLYDEISAVCRAVSEAGEVQVPDGLHERIMNSVRTQKRAARRRRTITYLGIGVAAMLCISVMSSTLIQRMGINEDDLIILNEHKDPTYSGSADSTEKSDLPQLTPPTDLNDGINDSEAEITGSMDNIPVEPSHSDISDWHDTALSTTVATTTAISTEPAMPDGTYSAYEGTVPTPTDTTPSPAETTLPLPETTAEYPEEDSTEKAGSFTGAPADVVPEEPEWTASEETTAAPAQTNAKPDYTMAVETEAVHDAPSAEGVQRPSSLGKPTHSLTTSAPSADFEICNVWMWKDADGVSHTLELRTDGTFTYTYGAKVTEGSFTFEDNVLTLRYGWLGKARYSVGVYKGNIALLHLSGRKLLG